MYWQVKAEKICKKFGSSQKALTYAKTFFEENPHREVLVEECGSVACFALLKYRAKKLQSESKV